MRCKYNKSGWLCGPGCHCLGYVNVPNSSREPETDELQDAVAMDVMYAEQEQQEWMDESDDGSDVDEDESDSETEQIMTSVFGDGISDEDKCD